MADIHSGIYRISTYLYFFVLLNLLFLLTCLPVITIPLATTGLFGAVRGFIRDGRADVFRPYFASIKENWKQGLAVGWLLIGVSLLLSTDLFIGLRIRSSIGTTMVFIVSLVLIAYAAIALNIFPVLVHSRERLVGLLKNAALLTVYKPLLTLVNWVILVLLFVVSIHVPLLFALFSFSLGAYVTYLIDHRKLKSVHTDSTPSQ